MIANTAVAGRKHIGGKTQVVHLTVHHVQSFTGKTAVSAQKRGGQNSAYCLKS